MFKGFFGLGPNFLTNLPLIPFLAFFFFSAVARDCVLSSEASVARVYPDPKATANGESASSSSKNAIKFSSESSESSELSDSF